MACSARDAFLAGMPRHLHFYAGTIATQLGVHNKTRVWIRIAFEREDDRFLFF